MVIDEIGVRMLELLYCNLIAVSLPTLIIWFSTHELVPDVQLHEAARVCQFYK